MKYIVLIIIICISLSGYAQTITSGSAFSMMLCDDSLVWTVGSNSIGQLGDGTTVDKLIPIDIGLTDIISVQAGASHSLALKSDGTVWSWGNNTSGQLGNNTTTPSSVPIQIPGLSDIVKIVSGGFHNVAVESDSTAWIWGDNQLNQINGTGTDKLFPIPGGADLVDVVAGISYTSRLFVDSTVRIEASGTKFLTISGIVSLGSGSNHVFMVKSDNTVWAWGGNQYGQLGDGTTTSQGGNTAVQVVGLSNIISIAGGQRHSMALKDDGTVWTWGWNGFGQLGNNTLVDELTAIQVPGLDSVVEIAAGSHNCLARRSDSTIWGWGSNILGQLGNDTATNTTIPVQMMLSCISFQCTTQVYSSDLSICQGDSISIFGAYQQTGGIYQDSLLTSQGCDSIMQTTLTIDSLPTVSFTGLDSTYCLDSTYTLTGSPTGGVFTGATGGVFSPVSIGVFTVTYSYTDINGCSSIYSQEVTVVDCTVPTRIEEIIKDDFKIYPNPSTGIINVTQKVEIRNTLGQVVFIGTGQIDLSESGIYFVKAGDVIKKLVITHP